MSTLLFVLLFILAVLIFLNRLLDSPKFKGWIGEKWIAKELKKLDPNQYVVLHDLLLPTADGKTAQIDHLVVSIHGVLVLEMKNYKGSIYGKEEDSTWTQVLGRNKHKFYSPIRQNRGHIRALQDILSDRPELPTVSIVVFSDKARLKVQTTTHVVSFSRLRATISAYREAVLTHEEMAEIRDRIEKARVVGSKARQQHVKVIQQDVKARKEMVESGICPRCGGELVERSGKYGTFTGCSGYPKCRFTLKH